METCKRGVPGTSNPETRQTSDVGTWETGQPGNLESWKPWKRGALETPPYKRRGLGFNPLGPCLGRAFPCLLACLLVMARRLLACLLAYLLVSYFLLARLLFCLRARSIHMYYGVWGSSIKCRNIEAAILHAARASCDVFDNHGSGALWRLCESRGRTGLTPLK